MASVRFSFCWVPPERWRTWVRTLASQSSWAAIRRPRRRACCLVSPHPAPKRVRCSSGIRNPNSPTFWGQHPRRPLTMTSPASGLTRPAQIFRNVDLPEPLAPTTATTSPAWTTRSTSVSTRRRPYVLVMPRACSRTGRWGESPFSRCSDADKIRSPMLSSRTRWPLTVALGWYRLFGRAGRPARRRTRVREGEPIGEPDSVAEAERMSRAIEVSREEPGWVGGG